MTHITLPRAVVEQALEFIETLRVPQNVLQAGLQIRDAEQVITALRAAIEASKEVEPSQDYMALLKEANEVVKGKSVYKRFIAGTPLSNDVAVWMADFAMLHAVYNPAPAAEKSAQVMCPVCETWVSTLGRPAPAVQEENKARSATEAVFPSPAERGCLPNILSTINEAALITCAYDRVRSERTFAAEDFEYDLFAAGWKACSMLAAAQEVK